MEKLGQLRSAERGVEGLASGPRRGGSDSPGEAGGGAAAVEGKGRRRTWS